MKHNNFIIFLSLISLLVSCNDNSDSSIPKDNDLSNVYAISYEQINSVDDIDEYAAMVVKDSDNNDDPVDNGIVKSPYYTLNINGTNVDVYATRTGSSMVHSFAFIDVDKNETGNYKIDVSITLNNYHSEVVVLPQSSNISASLKESNVTASIDKLGDFTFVFDKKPDEALTLMIKENKTLEVPLNYVRKEFEPGTYKIADTLFKDKNTIYYFKKGRYQISSINLPSNSILYFERGCYFDVISETSLDYSNAINCGGCENVQICGHALFDFSSNQGGKAGHKGKGTFGFSNCSNVSFSGITSINSISWTLCFTNCDNVEVCDNLLLGYRTCSDGIMLSDCQDSIVHHNFVRSGDDAIETKSTGSEHTLNLIYEYNSVWADKARCYGAIYESNNEINNVIYRHNSIGFSLATWSDNLGCLVINMGTRPACLWHDIHFEDIEIYKSYNSIMSIVLADSSGVGDGGTCKDIYFKDINVYRAYGYILFIKVQSGSTLGKVYIDNVNYNNLSFDAESINNKDISSISHYSSTWSKKLNIKVDTLNENE